MLIVLDSVGRLASSGDGKRVAEFTPAPLHTGQHLPKACSTASRMKAERFGSFCRVSARQASSRTLMITSRGCFTFIAFFDFLTPNPRAAGFLLDASVGIPEPPTPCRAITAGTSHDDGGFTGLRRREAAFDILLVPGSVHLLTECQFRAGGTMKTPFREFTMQSGHGGKAGAVSQADSPHVELAQPVNGFPHTPLIRILQMHASQDRVNSALASQLTDIVERVHDAGVRAAKQDYHTICRLTVEGLIIDDRIWLRAGLIEVERTADIFKIVSPRDLAREPDSFIQFDGARVRENKLAHAGTEPLGGFDR